MSTRIIETKSVSYIIPDDMEGIPIAEFMKDKNYPKYLEGAKVYTIIGRTIIARPEEPEA